MPSTSNGPKSHHYVPQFILRNFTDESGNLHCFNKKVDKIYPSSPRRAFMENHLYTYIFEDGSGSTHLEESLSKFESEVSNIVRKILEKVRNGCSISLTEREHNIWANFLVTQLARHPDRLSRLLGKDMIRKFVSDFERKFRPVHPAVKSYFLDPKRQERMVHNMFIETTIDDIYPIFAPLFASKNIVALVTEKKTISFVIGDTGVTRYPKAKHDLRHQDTKLLYPISWNIVLAWGFPWNSKDVISIPYDEMRIANELTLNQSDIIAGSSKELIESLSRKTKRV